MCGKRIRYSLGLYAGRLKLKTAADCKTICLRINMQLELFKIKCQVPPFIARLFAMANAGTYGGKDIFYHFKTWFLERHAVAAGYARQTIVKMCYTCDGTGWYRPGERCWNCDRGFYSVRIYFLKRHILNGKIFHCPVEHNQYEHSKYDLIGHQVVEEIDGYIRHDPVDKNKAKWAAIALFAVYRRIYLLAMIRHEFAAVRWRLRYKRERWLYRLNPRNHFYRCPDCMRMEKIFGFAVGDHFQCDDGLPF